MADKRRATKRGPSPESRDAKRRAGSQPDASTPPPLEPPEDSNPAHSLKQRGSYAGRPDQDIKHTTGAGAGGATEWGGGNKNHPSRIAGKPPGS
jgi:hypothetical protein